MIAAGTSPRQRYVYAACVWQSVLAEDMHEHGNHCFWACFCAAAQHCWLRAGVCCCQAWAPSLIYVLHCGAVNANHVASSHSVQLCIQA
jgi:hypothetical protein